MAVDESTYIVIIYFEITNLSFFIRYLIFAFYIRWDSLENLSLTEIRFLLSVVKKADFLSK
jgi:hypothetical protein